jgi:hypothetical protein
MESQRGQITTEQADAVRQAKKAARDHASTPAWYWCFFGVLVGALILAVSTGNSLACSIASLLILVGGGVLNRALSEKRGIRIGRVFGGAGSWLALPWFAALVGLAIAGNRFTAHLVLLWPGALAGVVALALTIGFGYLYDHVRLRSPESFSQ